MVDFSKLLNISDEEREERNRNFEKNLRQRELNELAEESPDFRKLVLTEEPEFRMEMSGTQIALLRHEHAGKASRAIVKSLINEDRDEFYDRVSSLKVGDEVVVHGESKSRNWKDAKGEWRSADEFNVGVVMSPESLKPNLQEDVSFPPSKFTRQQSNMQSQGFQR